MKNRKFTWIDGLVIAVLVLLIAGTCVKFFSNDPHATQQQTRQLTYTMSATAIRGEAVQALQPGDNVYESAGKGYVGTIVDVKATPAVSHLEMADGTLQKMTDEVRYDVVLTISAEGIDAGDHYQIGTYAIRVNRPSVCFTKYTAWDARILSLG